MQRGLVIDQMYSCRVEFFQATAQLGQPAVEVRQIVSKKIAEGGDALRIGVFGIEDDAKKAEKGVVFNDQNGLRFVQDFCSGSIRSARATRVCML